MKRSFALSAVVIVAAALVFTACGGKKDGGSGGSGKAAKSSGKASPVSDFSYDLSEDGKGIKIKGYTGTGGAVVIPATIEDMPVVEIEDHSFNGRGGNDTPNNRDAITSIVVPDSVVTIGGSAFAQIDELTKVTLPDGLKVIPRAAFSSCPKLTTVNLPASLEEIRFGAFAYCGELNNLVIPSTLTGVKFTEWIATPGFSQENLDNDAFRGCGKLPIKTRQTIQGWGYTSGF